MNAIICILVALISSSVSFAQNYQAINSKRIAFYEDHYHSVQCIRIDSVNNKWDSIFHPFPNILLTKSHPGEYWFVADSCWQPPVDGSCQNYFEYFNGLGGPYYECDNFTYNEVTNLVYYKKGEKPGALLFSN